MGARFRARLAPSAGTGNAPVAVAAPRVARPWWLRRVWGALGRDW
ncbi:MAG: hypothetical protein QOG28_2493 [Trebonia sp.]|jgi:hypothetical protein|nr:hypothetical protein [Trebonia sp.]